MQKMRLTLLRHLKPSWVLKMPLEHSSSKKAFSANVAKEIEAGKDPKQAAAIEYSVQRQNDSVRQYEMSCDSNLPLALTPRQIADENNQRRSS